MPGYHTIKTAARELAERVTDPELKILAELIVQLVDHAKRIERTAQDATRSGQDRYKSG
jgi:hypothetical protein